MNRDRAPSNLDPAEVANRLREEIGTADDLKLELVCITPEDAKAALAALEAGYECGLADGRAEREPTIEDVKAVVAAFQAELVRYRKAAMPNAWTVFYAAGDQESAERAALDCLIERLRSDPPSATPSLGQTGRACATPGPDTPSPSGPGDEPEERSRDY